MKGVHEMSESKKEVWVTGHKNPDTDSICSAICYARLKNMTAGSDVEYVAKRAGDVNGETEYVLSYFGEQAPDLVTDVRPQLSDVVFHRIKGVDETMSIKDAWNKMKENNVVTLPIVNGKKLKGIVTIGDLSRSVFDVSDRYQMSQANTPYKNIASVLEAEVITGDINKDFSNGKILISAADEELMQRLIGPGDIVILENREDSHINAIETKAGCIVVCDGSDVSADVVSAAESTGCIILKTQYDPFSCARFINQSIPIRSICRDRDDLITFVLDDFVEDVTQPMTEVRYRYFPVEDDNGDFVGLVSKGNLLSVGKKQMILVDHEEKGQAVDGIETAELLEIVDHHRLGGMTTPQPLTARIQPVGCTCTILYQMYQEAGVTPDKSTAGLLLSAIISDTLLFRSPTCTGHDKIAAKELAEIADVDMDSFAMEMFKAGSELGCKTAEEIFFMDFKEFDMDGKKIGVGQATTVDSAGIADIHKKISGVMDGIVREKCLDNAFLMITDIINESSTVVCGGEDGVGIMEKAFDTKAADEDSVYLPGVVSRKKQMVPALMGVLA